MKPAGLALAPAAACSPGTAVLAFPGARHFSGRVDSDEADRGRSAFRGGFQFDGASWPARACRA